ncbi:MAG: (d)CMP kinase [Candidatus Dasytiphilus stammeri]
MSRIIPVITIDGPAGAGKSVLCCSLAQRLHWNSLDSGAIYRVFAWSVITNKISIRNEKELLSMAKNGSVSFFLKGNGNYEIFLEKKNITNIIRMEKIGKLASHLAKVPSVRKVLTDRLRSYRKKPGLIAEGRDMGTVVFPDAMVKFFLDASVEERSRRRVLQLHNKGFSVKFNKVLNEIKLRDERDRSRLISPLIPAADAIILDSTGMNLGEVIKKAYTYLPVSQFSID